MQQLDEFAGIAARDCSEAAIEQLQTAIEEAEDERDALADEILASPIATLHELAILLDICWESGAIDLPERQENGELFPASAMLKAMVARTVDVVCGFEFTTLKRLLRPDDYAEFIAPAPPLADLPFDGEELRARVAALAAEFGQPLQEEGDAGLIEALHRYGALHAARKGLSGEFALDFDIEEEIVLPALDPLDDKFYDMLYDTAPATCAGAVAKLDFLIDSFPDERIAGCLRQVREVVAGSAGVR